jgi:hypothetical protein
MLILSEPSNPNESCAIGHVVPLVKIDNKIYYFDVTGFSYPSIGGPFNNIRGAANAAWPSWTAYIIARDHPWDDTKSIYSKPFKEWIGSVV